MRYHKRFFGLVVSVLLLSACGGQPAAPGAASSTAASTGAASTPASLEASAAAETAPQTSTAAATESSAAAAFPVTIEHKYGSTTIPAEPQRVVSVGYRDHEHLLALGVTPIGVRDWYGNGYETIFWPWSEAAIGDAQPEIVGTFDTINFEQVAALNPDLIVGVYSGMSEDVYKTLSQIAPTLVQSGEYVDFGMPWQEETRMIGSAVGQSAKAETLIAGIEEQFTAARAANPEFEGASVAAAQLDSPGVYWILSPDDHKARFLTALGFEFPDEIAGIVGAQSNAQISQERLDLLDRDVLVWLMGSERGWADAPKMADAVKNDPVYQQLAVVKDGRDVFAETAADAIAWSTPLSLPFALDELVPQLAAATDDDPATKP